MRGAYDEPRLSELVNMYNELGFEVRLEDFQSELFPGCSECMKEAKGIYKILYTKKN